MADAQGSSLHIKNLTGLFGCIVAIQPNILKMRVDEFIPLLNDSIERYSHWIKIFIASISILIAYNYFFVPSVLLMSVGTLVYVYMKTLRPAVISQINRDWPTLDEARNTLIPPIELAAPAPETIAAPTPAPTPAAAPIDK
jgi:hypothetical protein